MSRVVTPPRHADSFPTTASLFVVTWFTLHSVLRLHHAEAQNRFPYAFSTRLISTALPTFSGTDIYTKAKTIIKGSNHLRHKLFSPLGGPEKRSQRRFCFYPPAGIMLNRVLLFLANILHKLILRQSFGNKNK